MPPLIVTPPYPSYAGNLATIGASAARALELTSGTNDMPVAVTWKRAGGLPDVVRQYDGFWQAMDTFKDKQQFDELLQRGSPPWEVWRGNGRAAHG